MHTFLRTVNTATIALRRNVMRSALTCLGIIIGVSAVIAIAEIGQGSSAAIQKSISSIGANMLLVLPGTATSSGVNWGSGSVMTLIPDDCTAILREVPGCPRRLPGRASQIITSSLWKPKLDSRLDQWHNPIIPDDPRLERYGRGRAIHRS